MEGNFKEIRVSKGYEKTKIDCKKDLHISIVSDCVRPPLIGHIRLDKGSFGNKGRTNSIGLSITVLTTSPKAVKDINVGRFRDGEGKESGEDVIKTNQSMLPSKSYLEATIKGL